MSLSPPPLHLGVVCTPEQYALSLSDSTLIHCMTRGQSIGLSITAEAGLLSIAAITILLLLVIRNAIKLWRSKPNEKWSLVQEPADIYMLSLFISDMIQAIGAAMDLKWIHSGIVVPGDYCTAQGIVQQIGETSVAMTTGVIAVHTFISVWWRKFTHGRMIAMFVIASIWIYVILFAVIGNAVNRRFETPTPYWCWIGSHHSGDRITGEYLWLWLTLLISALVHIPLYLLIRGNIILDPTQPWWYFEYHRHPQGEKLSRARRASLSMLAFPAVYSLLILPLSIVRWITFANSSDHVPSAWTFFAVTIFGLSGFFNVLLLLFARPDLLLFGRVRRLRSAVMGEDHQDEVHAEQDDYFAQNGGIPMNQAKAGTRPDGGRSMDRRRTVVPTPRGMAPSLHTQSSRDEEEEEVGIRDHSGGLAPDDRSADYYTYRGSRDTLDRSRPSGLGAGEASERSRNPPPESGDNFGLEDELNRRFGDRPESYNMFTHAS